MSGSHGQSHKVVSVDVIGRWMTQGICKPNMNTETCIDLEKNLKLQVRLKYVCGHMNGQTERTTCLQSFDPGGHKQWNVLKQRWYGATYYNNQNVNSQKEKGQSDHINFCNL